MRRILLACFALILSGCLDQKGGGSAVVAPAQAAVHRDEPALIQGKKGVGHRDFAGAKKVLPQVFAGIEEDFYCGCRYTGKEVDLASCGYVARKNENRASRIEWEHVVPAAQLGLQQQCWQQGGRKNCSGKDAAFDRMEGDLNNLVPAVGEVNGDRGNMSYGAWTRAPEHVYGQCASVPDFRNRRFQPRDEVRGRAARISLYMASRYGLSVSRQDRQLWCAWAKSHPVDQWEKTRNERILKLQGEGNPLVSDSAALGRVCG